MDARLKNQEIIGVFRHIADLLEIKGEVIYKILAYRKAADSLEILGRDIKEVWREGRLREIPGVGKAIAEKIDELLSTGQLEYLVKLEQQVPPSLVDILEVPDVGPKKVSLFWKELGITNLTELEKAARAGDLRSLPGMGEKSETRVIAGIEALARRTDRTPIGRAWPFAQELLSLLRAVPGVKAVEVGGSLRRMRSTVGDLDLLAAAVDSKAVMQAFVNHPDVIRVLSQGETKASVEYNHGLNAQLWVHHPERFGTALQYATGAKDHNVRLRELAIKRGFSLSDQALLTEGGEEILCANEQQVYELIGLPWITPELREDRGEIKAAKKDGLPALIKLEDMKSELHAHSTWSDGKLSIREMAEAALKRGKKLLAITDHSGSLAIAGGLSLDDIKKQRLEIDAVQEELGDSIKLLQGIEVEIRADGSLDFPDEALEEMDIVIAALHSGLRGSRKKVTQRTLDAIGNPHVDVIAHPTGRLIPNREGADLDMDAILAAAIEHNVAMEINAHPSRLDLDEIYARRLLEMGGLLCINTDAHAASDLDLLHFGVATARRGWVTPHQVINTWDTEHLLGWLQARS